MQLFPDFLKKFPALLWWHELLKRTPGWLILKNFSKIFYDTGNRFKKYVLEILHIVFLVIYSVVDAALSFLLLTHIQKKSIFPFFVWL